MDKINIKGENTVSKKINDQPKDIFNYFFI